MNQDLKHIIIADDHTFARNAMRKLLTAENTLYCIYEASNGSEVLELLDKNRIDLIILDIQMPVLNGFDTIKEAKQKHPSVKVVVLTQHDEFILGPHLIALGADSFLSKLRADMKDILNEVNEILVDRTDSDRANISKEGRTSPSLNLTRREYQILVLLSRGKATKEIAALLNLQVYTIDSYRKHLIQKSNCRNTADLISFAFRTGLIDFTEI